MSLSAQQELRLRQAEGKMLPEHRHFWTHGPGKGGESEHCRLVNLTGALEAGKAEDRHPSYPLPALNVDMMPGVVAAIVQSRG